MNFFVVLLYEITLSLFACFAIPKMLYQWTVHKKYSQSLLARLGFKDQGVTRKANSVVWIHAVSLGETKAIVKLAKELKSFFPSTQFIISSITETGFNEAKQSLPFADHLFLPIDFWLVMAPLVKKIRPNCVIISETDLWFNFLRESKKRGASIALVNGKLSSKSMRKFSMVPFFSKQLLGLFSKIGVQNEAYKERFLSIGALPDRIEITGNLKFDDEYPVLSEEELQAYREHLGIRLNQQVVTIGSTHYPEEEMLIDQLKNQDLKMLLVPRHPERFEEVAQVLTKKQIPFIRWSQISERSGKERVILVDAMGVLRLCYQLGDIAIVGGSFTPKVGGHNILEPCYYGKPVIFGPYMYSQPELVQVVKEYEAGVQLPESEVASIVEEWMSQGLKRKSIGQRGLQLVLQSRGSTKKTLDALKPVLKALFQ